jgi:hypothetical protein
VVGIKNDPVSESVDGTENDHASGTKDDHVSGTEDN